MGSRICVHVLQGVICAWLLSCSAMRQGVLRLQCWATAPEHDEVAWGTH